MSEDDKTLTHEKTQPIPRDESEHGKNPGRSNPAPAERTGMPMWAVPLWLLTILSLVLNVVVIRQIIVVRELTRLAINDAVEVIGSFREESFAYTFVVDDTLAIDTDMPVDETIPVAIKQTIPIDTVVEVPVNLGAFGTYPVDLPIRTDIDVDLQQDIVIDQSFHVQAAVPVYIEVPVEIAISETPLDETLSEVESRLMGLSDQLATGLLPSSGANVEP